MDQISQDLKNYIQELPQELQDYIKQSNWIVTVKSIALKYTLDDDTSEKLQTETFMVLLALETVSDFKYNLRENIPQQTLNNEVLDSVEHEIYTEVFQPVHRDLDVLIEHIDAEFKTEGEKQVPTLHQETPQATPEQTPVPIATTLPEVTIPQPTPAPEPQFTPRIDIPERKQTYGEIRYVPETKLRQEPKPQQAQPQSIPTTPAPEPQKPVSEPVSSIPVMEIPEKPAIKQEVQAIPQVHIPESHEIPTKEEHHELMIRPGLTEPIVEAQATIEIPLPEKVFIQTEAKKNPAATNIQQPSAATSMSSMQSEEEEVDEGQQPSIVGQMLQQHTTQLPKEEIVFSNKKPAVNPQNTPQNPSQTPRYQGKDPYREPIE